MCRLKWIFPAEFGANSIGAGARIRLPVCSKLSAGLSVATRKGMLPSALVSKLVKKETAILEIAN
jgi:hypothetical protein